MVLNLWALGLPQAFSVQINDLHAIGPFVPAVAKAPLPTRRRIALKIGAGQVIQHTSS